jgi:hypothetical protein
MSDKTISRYFPFKELTRRKKNSSEVEYDKALSLSAFMAFSVLSNGRIFGRITQKEQNKKWSGQINLRPNFGWFCTERAEKGAELQ